MKLIRFGCWTLWCLTAVLLAGCGDQYPKDWPRPAGSWWSRLGSCPDLRGDYGDMTFRFPSQFGMGSTMDRWSANHARITQAEDGSWMRVEFGLTAEGLRAARGEQGVDEPSFQGVGHTMVLRESDHYRCSGGWLHSLAREEVDGDSMRYEELRFAKDREGGLIASETTTREQSIGWGDSPGVSLGRGTRVDWQRWPPREPNDEAEVRKLEGIKVQRAGWINNGRSVPTYFSNFYQKPICARLVRSWRIDGQKPIVTRADEMRRSRDEVVPDVSCPTDSGEMAPLMTTIWQVDVPDPDSALGDYRIEWQHLGQVDEPWQVHAIQDVRTLPIRDTGR
ncbi:MAG: hypothetical protein IPK97_20795 [Ahniella sp.]|nr:hypothetical protein [Ahniella sp.]